MTQDERETFMWDVYHTLEDLGKPIRIPTTRWLMSDLFNVVDDEVNRALTAASKLGLVKIDNGGWITCL